MSLRKSPQLTPALLAAARANAQHSTGPRSAAARLWNKFNPVLPSLAAERGRKHCLLNFWTLH